MMKLPDAAVIAQAVDPEEAINFWKDRAKLTDAEARSLGEGAKHRAFYVSGLADRQLVRLVKEGIGDALKNGDTLAQFKKNIVAAIETQGWTSYRVENIFRTNMQMAYAAGRYKKMQNVKASRPYWQYIAVGDRRTRPSHAILNGKVYPADHAFWDINYPPNGFRCRCTVRTLSERQLKKQGLKVETEMPKPDVWTDPETGMEYFVNMPGADRGFANNPGKDWLSGIKEACVEEIEKTSSYQDAASFVRELVNRSFDTWKTEPKGNFPLAVLSRKDAAELGSQKTVAMLSAETYQKQLRHHPELSLSDYALAQDAVEKGLKLRQDDKKMAYVLEQPGGVVVVVKATRIGDELYVTSLRRLSRDENKRNQEIMRLKRQKKEG